MFSVGRARALACRFPSRVAHVFPFPFIRGQSNCTDSENHRRLILSRMPDSLPFEFICVIAPYPDIGRYLENEATTSSADFYIDPLEIGEPRIKFRGVDSTACNCFEACRLPSYGLTPRNSERIQFPCSTFARQHPLRWPTLQPSPHRLFGVASRSIDESARRKKPFKAGIAGKMRERSTRTISRASLCTAHRLLIRKQMANLSETKGRDIQELSKNN